MMRQWQYCGGLPENLKGARPFCLASRGDSSINSLRSDRNRLRPGAARVDERAADGDLDGAAVWRRIMDAVARLANTTPSGPVN